MTDENEVEVLKKLHKFDKTLPAIGVKMKTGLTVDFRNRDILGMKRKRGQYLYFIHSI